MNQLTDILNAFKAGDLSLADAIDDVRGTFFRDVGHSTLDLDRPHRTGAAEVVYGAGKTPEQISDLVCAMTEHEQNVLVTRTDIHAWDAVKRATPDARFHETARAITVVRNTPDLAATPVAIVTAGTSDLPVAEEAAVTAEFYASPVNRVTDVGVAGIHRLMARIDDIREARVVIVIAGMEGALPSVVGGLVDKPVIAVPPSVGYGASFGGIAALLGMLNSCASGLSVVNIDNGFGAGYLANMINRL